ncbi:MAG: hypothetical protein DCC51_16030, partial [Anaerolineae bacterium]
GARRQAGRKTRRAIRIRMDQRFMIPDFYAMPPRRQRNGRERSKPLTWALSGQVITNGCILFMSML